MHTAIQVMAAIKQQLNDPAFQAKHRENTTAFTRKRLLSFERVVVVILQKSLTSLQLLLNDVFERLQHTFSLPNQTVTASAFTQARQKLKHTAFDDLTTQTLVPLYYQTASYRTWHGFRIIALDGSMIRLPETPALREAFGTMAFANQQAEVRGTYPCGRCVVYYDVLNQMPLASTLAPCTKSEADVALALRPAFAPTDILLCDRGFPSYEFLATFCAAKTHVVARCSRRSFAAAQALFAEDAPPSRVVTLPIPRRKRAAFQSAGLPMTVTLRFVRVVLETNEVEVLVTTLLDEVAMPTTRFKTLYGLRWGIETFYDRLKTRLAVEHFTGTSVEAVKQDVFATIFLSGLEMILIQDAQQQLADKTPQNRYPQQVNHAVAFHAIKQHAIDLLLSDRDPQTLVSHLTQLFLTNPSVVRPGRSVTRRTRAARQLVHYYKRIKKICL